MASGVVQRFFKYKDAATYLGISASQVRALVDAGKLKPRRAAGPPRLDVAELDRLMGAGGTVEPTNLWDEALNGGDLFRRPCRKAKAARRDR
jgi:hypothetical protein